MAEPRVWVIGDPEPDLEVDAVYAKHPFQAIWWRIGANLWQSLEYEYPRNWDQLVILGPLYEAVAETEYTATEHRTLIEAVVRNATDYIDYFKVADNE